MIGREFHLDKAAQAPTLTVFFITYYAFQIAGGLSADRICARRTTPVVMGALTDLSSIGFLLLGCC